MPIITWKITGRLFAGIWMIQECRFGNVDVNDSPELAGGCRGNEEGLQDWLKYVVDGQTCVGGMRWK